LEPRAGCIVKANLCRGPFGTRSDHDSGVFLAVCDEHAQCRATGEPAGSATP
jgi:hypothetical protein